MQDEPAASAASTEKEDKGVSRRLVFPNPGKRDARWQELGLPQPYAFDPLTAL